MTDQPGAFFPPPTGAQMGQPPPAPPPAMTQAEAQAAAAEQLAAQAAASPGVDAGESVEQMQASQREVLLPMEQQIQDMMAAFQAQQAQMAAQIAQLQNQLATAQAGIGPPAVEQYAQGIATLLKAHADANPDVGRDTFKPALEAADKLKAAATAAVTSRDTADMEKIAGEVRQWVGRFRGKHLDWSSVLADLDLLGEAAVRLAA